MTDDETDAMARPAVVFYASIAAVLVTGFAFPRPRLLPMPYTPVGLVVIAAGFCLGVTQRRSMNRHHQSGVYVDLPSALITDGPFRFSRNPLYLGMVLMVLGLALLFGGWIPAVVAPVSFLAMHFWVVPLEESRLRRALGPDYEAYRARVRRWL